MAEILSAMVKVGDKASYGTFNNYNAKISALPVNLDVEEDEQAERDDPQKDQPAPAVVGRVDRVHPQLRQTDRRMNRQIRQVVRRLKSWKENYNDRACWIGQFPFQQ